MTRRTRHALLLAAVMSPAAIAAYLPVIGARSVRFQTERHVQPVGAASLPPLPMKDDDEATAVVAMPVKDPAASEPRINSTLGPIQGTPGNEEFDPTTAGLPDPLDPDSIYGPPEPQAEPGISPQAFLRFFTPKSTNRVGVVNVPATFTPPVAKPPGQSSATLEIR